MTGESPGRERAIETLMDMEPQGPFYRAARILDEAVPNALSSRPNLITRSALVEQAHALGIHEIDSIQKYEKVFGSIPDRSLSPVGTTHKERVLRHHLKIEGSTTNAPPPDLVLRRLYGDDFSLLRKLLSVASATDEEIPLEHLIGNVCRDDQPSLQGLLLASLSVLTGSIQSASLKQVERDSYLDTRVPSLQVGGVLSLLKLDSEDSELPRGFLLDQDLLDYFGKAAAIYEERIEIHKSQLAAKLQQDDTPMTPEQLASSTLLDDEAAASAAIFDRMISTVTGEETSSAEDVHEDSDSDSSEDTRYEPTSLPQIAIDGGSSSDSSSSEDRPQAMGDEDVESDEDDEDEDDEDDDEVVEDDDMLRQALAMSLADQSLFAVEEGTNDTAITGILEAANYITEQTSMRDPTVEEQPPSETPPLVGDADDVDGDDSLPPFPVPPSHYPYESVLDSLNDLEYDLDRSEAKETGRFSYMDPNAMAKFGTIPSSHVLVHLLRTAILSIRRKRDVSGEENTSIPGGMGGSLFLPKQTSSESQETMTMDAQDGEDHSTPLQLIVAVFLIMFDNRENAIQNLRHAVSIEQRGDDDHRSELPLSVEDDPALVLAMNYVEDNAATLQSAESLEAKGMRRKAAAAAHEAAIRLKSLRKQTQAWKMRVKLLSQCTFLIMKCLRTYLQSIVCQWLQQKSSITSVPASSATSAADCHEFLPSSVRSKLSMALSSLMTVSSFRSFSSFITGEDSDDVEDVFLPFMLYREALSTWGECVPLLFHSSAARAEILRSLIHECPTGMRSAITDLDSLQALPSSDSEPQLHRLQVLCRRLCVSDLLDSLVPHPAVYSLDNSTVQDLAQVEFRDETESQQPALELIKANSIVSLVGSPAAACQGGERDDLQRLYLALCHRCNVQMLLWDGLHAVSLDELDEIVATSSPVALTTTDTLRVNSNPSPSLHFDSTKCSESIAILSNLTDSPAAVTGPSAHQRASKVWGTVLSSSFFSPKTGVHRWAVKLDRCERGHVFVGVATAQATMRTYVGGDKFGWGVIGTQALWHDRRKIRGDYGATFRTGSTIIVTLDTDAGTLSFSSWKDSNNVSSFSLDPLLQTMSPSRRQAPGGAGTTEDWGVAFEGLPLDSRLYPAVGLYQRDDRVTLLSVESGGRASIRDGVLDGEMLSGPACFYPRIPKPMSAKASIGLQRRLAQVRRHNNVFSWDGLEYVASQLKALCESLHSPQGPQKSTLTSVLPSIAAALCMVPPSIPVLSRRFALMLLPDLSRCIRGLHGTLSGSESLFSERLREGKWIIRATGSSGVGSADFEEYVVTISTTKSKAGIPIGFEGTGVGTTGRSKNGLVAIVGTVRGSGLHFVEEWTDGTQSGSSAGVEEASSSCVVAARLSLDGNKFEGTYRHVQFGTTGHIAGMYTKPDSVVKTNENELRDAVMRCEALLCLAHGHLSIILGEDLAGDHGCNFEGERNEQSNALHCAALGNFLTSPLLSSGLLDNDGSKILRSLQSLKDLYAPPLHCDLPTGMDQPFVTCAQIIEENRASTPHTAFVDLSQAVHKMDDELTSRSGGKGSLSSLCAPEYTAARQKIICALLYHGHLDTTLLRACKRRKHKREISEPLIATWRTSLRIMEDSIRKALSSKRRTESTTRRDVCVSLCQLNVQISSFLLALQRSKPQAMPVSQLATQAVLFFSLVENSTDLLFLEGEMARETSRTLLRMLAFRQIGAVLLCVAGESRSMPKSPIPIECTMVSVPRLMGRSRAKATMVNGVSPFPHDGITCGEDDLGGYYLSQMSGSVHIATRSVHAIVHDMYRLFGSILSKVLGAVQGYRNTSIDSLLLSVLAAYSISIRADDIPLLATETGILNMLPLIFSLHRESIRSEKKSREMTNDCDNVSLVQAMHDIGERDMSRALLRAGVSVTHVLSFQLTQHLSAKSSASSDQTLLESLELCLQLIFGELGQTIPLVESSIFKDLDAYAREQANEEWDKCVEICSSGGSTRSQNVETKQKLHKKLGSGVAYLIENGSLPSLQGGYLSLQRSLTRTGGSAASHPPVARSEYLLSLKGPSCHQHLSQWLHLLCCVMKSQSALPAIGENADWIDLLLRTVGLCCTRNINGLITDVGLRQGKERNLLPGRYRARILRLLPSLLSSLTPTEKLVQGLFYLSGIVSPIAYNGVDSDETLVSREAVSLLRHLHSPVHPEWRACIHHVISAGFESDPLDGDVSTLKVGILSFFAGSVGTIGQGSYVLMKPAAVVPLSSEAQSPNSKSHGTSGTGTSGSGVGATPHHVVGNGTEGIIAGLCRSEATAGIVSSVDARSGICEVILMERHRAHSSVESALVPAQISSSSPDGGEKGPMSVRHTLTVRALRTPLSDVAHAEEVPLFLDLTLQAGSLLGITLPAALDQITQSFSDAFKGVTDDNALNETKMNNDGPCEGDVQLESSDRNDDPLDESDVTNLCASLMSLRAAIVVASDERLLSHFTQTLSSRNVFSRVLGLASADAIGMGSAASEVVEAARTECLSALPHHEARYNHLLSMLREVRFRRSLLDMIAEEHWETRIAEHRALNNEEDRGDQRFGSDGVDEGYMTPPANDDSAVDTPPALGTAAFGEVDGASDARTLVSNARRAISQSSVSTNSTEEEEDSEAATTAAAHLLEAAIAQMAELGLPRSWSELALRRTGGTNIEAAVHFCLERGGDMERLLSEERERERMMQRQSTGSSSIRRRGNRGDGGSNHLLRQLLEMGFPSRWCAEALAATRNNVDEALTWILTNGERLSAEDEGMEEDDEEGDEEDAEEEEEEEESVDDEDDEEVLHERVEGSNVDPEGLDAVRQQSVDGSQDHDSEQQDGAYSSNPGNQQSQAESEAMQIDAMGWSGSVTPLRFISGRSIINPQTLSVSGLPTSGFSSVGTKGILLTSGKWYYEAVLETAGCLQIGWADGSFSGHCHADRGDGCGDGPSSWAYDGWRRYRWHASATEWGCRWKEGDVVGCLVDMDEHVVSFTLNGRGEEIGMGVAFSGHGFRPCGGVFACVSFNRREKLRLILGGKGSEAFKYQPPAGYKGVGDAILDSVEERDRLLKKEQILNSGPFAECVEVQHEPCRFLCDFSDGEHGHELFAWQHRYYGSDASVHLGSGRGSKQSNGNQKNYTGGATLDLSVISCVSRRLEKEWPKEGESPPELMAELDASRIKARMKRGYAKVTHALSCDLVSECIALGILYARKLVMHVIVTMGVDFDLKCFVATNRGLTGEKSEVDAARRLWRVLDICVSLRSAGWVGEAGAMAVAAEALGLGISSNDHSARGSMTERAGVTSVIDHDEIALLPAAGVSQLLSTALNITLAAGAVAGARETGRSLAACAEAAIGGDGGGGPLVFLQRGLQSAVSKSAHLRDLLVAVIRQSVRLLAVVDYAGNDSSTLDSAEDDDIDGSSNSFEKSRSRDGKEEDDQDKSQQPDARLTSFLTGLLLSKPVQRAVSNHSVLMRSLFEAWSVGLLSASAPWRMVCALTASGILNQCPEALSHTVESLPTLARFYGRLPSTVCRRIWAERAAVPVCSRYVQAMIELLASVQRSTALFQPKSSHVKAWGNLSVDAATPIPFMGASALNMEMNKTDTVSSQTSWEWDDGWVASDAGWEVWSGSVECMEVDWKAPSRSAVRTLMDGGEGPPMLREGCTVLRGLDWEECGMGQNAGDADGKDLYEAEKTLREKEKRAIVEPTPDEEARAVEVHSGNSREHSGNERNDDVGPAVDQMNVPPIEGSLSPEQGSTITSRVITHSSSGKKKKRKKIPNPKLPIGTVVSIEPWNGIAALGRRVRWHLTGIEGVYRYGGDGGRYDISHVEVNEKSTRVRKRHPLPESAEQCAARHGFGVGRKYSVLLRLRRQGQDNLVDGDVEVTHRGILEWPDFGAGVRVDCIFHSDGAVSVIERELLYGSKDSGWEARFGQPSFVPGSVTVLSPTGSLKNQADLDARSSFLSLYEELLGSCSFAVEALRDRANGSKIRITSEMRLLRGRCSPRDLVPTRSPAIPALAPPPIQFDPDFHAPSMALSQDGRTVTCISPDGRGTAFASIGFTKGIHYWEVKLEQADIGSVYIGVAEKPNGAVGSAGSTGGSSFDQDNQPRLNRWHGWGFVNFRATYTAGAERVYGAHCHAGDTVGVLLDCDAGRVSFFFDGLKYGEHILNDLGCAFENLSPFGFNADGCGSGGAGQGAPSGVEGGRGGRYPAHGAVRPRALWPVIGLRNPSDRVTLSAKWMTSVGVDGATTLKNILAVDQILAGYDTMSNNAIHGNNNQDSALPTWFVDEAFREYTRWISGRCYRSVTRGSGPYRMTSFGLCADLDASPLACASACAALGLKYALLPGDRVIVKRSAGRILELAEEAVVLGAYQGRLFYRIVSQKSEGGSLTEGGGRAWFWDESEVVDDGLQLVGDAKGLGASLPTLDRFRCLSPGGLRIVYEGGAVVRSDLEIFDGSATIGTIPVNAIIAQEEVLERRINSCGVVRYRIRYESIGEGWISSRIRGGKEEPIVEPVLSSERNTCDDDSKQAETVPRFSTPQECALVWNTDYQKALQARSTCSPNMLVKQTNETQWKVQSLDEFTRLLRQGRISGHSVADSDSLLLSAVNAVADFSEGGDAVDCAFDDVASALSFAVASSRGEGATSVVRDSIGNPSANQAAAAILATLNIALPSAKALLARVAILRAFNRRARVALPWLSVRPSQEGTAVFGGLCGHGASIERAGRNQPTQSMELWVQAPCIASRIRTLRGLFFSSVKRGLVVSITDATTTPTPLSHDEYELPREIRTVRINRLKARRAMAGDDNRTKRKHSVFSQLYNETRSWGGAALRRGFVAKGHGGQKRAFKVKLVGEGVNDYSGPYREVFTDAMHEILQSDENGRGVLGVLDPTPNHVSEIGDDRDLFMFSMGDRDLVGTNHTNGIVSAEELRIRDSFSILMMAKDEGSREVEDSLMFLGRLTGTACRHRIPVDIPLPMEAVWKAMTEEKSDELGRFRELDLLASRSLATIGANEKPLLLCWQKRMLNSFVDGMSNVLPVEVLSLLSGGELRDMLCGNPDVDVDLLRRVVEYEGYSESDNVIQYFWDTLREMSSDDRKKFLQFVWARSRLPMKESDFEAPFKIQKDTVNSGDNTDAALPSASTCFFSLTLPEYSSMEILKKKLMFAIRNVCTMESDYVTNDAEVGEGWRGL